MHLPDPGYEVKYFKELSNLRHGSCKRLVLLSFKWFIIWMNQILPVIAATGKFVPWFKGKSSLGNNRTKEIWEGQRQENGKIPRMFWRSQQAFGTDVLGVDVDGRRGGSSKRRFGRIFKIIVTMILISISLPVLSSAQLDTIYCHFGLMPHQISNRYEFHFLIANGSLSSKGIEVLIFRLTQLTI